MGKNYIYINYSTESFRNQMNTSVQNYRLTFKKTLEPLKQPSIQKKIVALVIEIYGKMKHMLQALSGNEYSIKLPIIAVIHDNNWELIRKCGKTGIERVISVEELHKIEQFICEVLNHHEVKVKDIFIDNRYDHPDTVQKTLKILENNYLNISTVDELSDMLKMHPSYVSQLFKDHKLYKPKKVLTYMKIRHALNMMESDHFSLEEIRKFSGFENYPRFKRSITEIFNMSPQNVKNEVKNSGAETVWNKWGPTIPSFYNNR